MLYKFLILRFFSIISLIDKWIGLKLIGIGLVLADIIAAICLFIAANHHVAHSAAEVSLSMCGLMLVVPGIPITIVAALVMPEIFDEYV